MVFFTVNLFEILHASTYGIYNYIYKVKKMPRMATLSYSHHGNPGRGHPYARYIILNKKA